MVQSLLLPVKDTMRNNVRIFIYTEGYMFGDNWRQVGDMPFSCSLDVKSTTFFVSGSFGFEDLP